MAESPMSLDPPQWSPMTEPPHLDEGNVDGESLDQGQAEDWIDWMKWDDKEVTTGVEESTTPCMHPQMLTPDTQESEKMSTRSTSSRSSRSSSVKLNIASTSVGHSAATLVTPKSTCTALFDHSPSNPSPKTSSSRSSIELMPGSVMESTFPSNVPLLTASHAARPNKKRKSTEDPSQGFPPAESKVPQAAKRPHNMVERRYRNNLNEKIAALRDSVPSLRMNKAPTQTTDDVEYDNNREEAQKLNKGSILAKATDYISHLELRARRLEEENLALKNRLRRQERLIEQREMIAPSILQSASDAKKDKKVNADAADSVPADSVRPSSPRGLIPIPESFRRLRMNSSQAHYADRIIHDQTLDEQDVKEGKPRGKLMTRMMIGSLAGLMVMDSLATDRTKGERSNVQGLLAIPIDLISTLATWLHLSQASNLFPLGHLHAGLLPVVRFFLALNILFFLLFVYLFSSKPMGMTKHTPTGFGAALSLSSPIQIRRQAWLTSIQTIWVPRHTLLAEFIATMLEALKYLVRCLVGWPVYSWLTGRTEDYEVARRKALDILIDAQLAGGDPEISRSRLVLTVFASGTVPNTTTRVMVKALHSRIILWRVGRPGSLSCRLADAAAKRVARYQWAIAQRLARADAAGDNADRLPPYLTNLLRYSCDEILNDSIIHRTYNLAWARPLLGGVEKEDSMNAVAEDAAVRSPLDAVAAWWSTSLLNRGLFEILGDRIDSSTIVKLLDIAQSTAPTSSVAQMRAHAARAIFVKSERVPSINHLLDALPPRKASSIQLQSSPYVPATNFFASKLPVRARQEIRHATSCVIVIALLENDSHSPSRKDISSLLQMASIEHQHMTLLGFISLRQLLRSIQRKGHAFPRWEAQARRSLRTWASKKAAKSTGDRQEIFWRGAQGVADEMDDSLTSRIRRWSNDTGYESQSDCAEMAKEMCT